MYKLNILKIMVRGKINSMDAVKAFKKFGLQLLDAIEILIAFIFVCAYRLVVTFSIAVGVVLLLPILLLYGLYLWATGKKIIIHFRKG